ncbi:hypothetical protein GCM10011428_61200 [Streptomyces violaceus]
MATPTRRAWQPVRGTTTLPGPNQGRTGERTDTASGLPPTDPVLELPVAGREDVEHEVGGPHRGVRGSSAQCRCVPCGGAGYWSPPDRLPPNVTTSRPSEAKDQRRAPA